MIVPVGTIDVENKSDQLEKIKQRYNEGDLLIRLVLFMTVLKASVIAAKEVKGDFNER